MIREEKKTSSVVLEKAERNKKKVVCLLMGILWWLVYTCTRAIFKLGCFVPTWRQMAPCKTPLPDLSSHSLHSMAFQFISGNIGPEERRVIRAHVMVGKNAGRPRPTHRKQRVATKQSISTHTASHPANGKSDKMQPPALSKPELFDRLISNDLAFNQLSQQSDHSVQLLRDCT